jgi:hypothetical protein
MSGVQQRIADIGEDLYVCAQYNEAHPAQLDVRYELTVHRAFQYHSAVTC